MYTQDDLSRDMLTQRVIGAAIEVHRQLGPGLLEGVYQECLCHELSLRAISFLRQKIVPVKYKSITLGEGLRLDLLVEGQLIVELKVVDQLSKVHEAQLLTYLRLSGLQRGLLLNFNTAVLKDGIKRLVNNYEATE